MKQFSPEQFAKLLGFATNDNPEKVDALIFIEGDGGSRIEDAIVHYQEGRVKKLVITGEDTRNPKASESRTKAVYKKAVKKVPARDIIVEDYSINSGEQGREAMKLVRDNNWKNIKLMVALYHQPRAYATFIKAMNEAGIKIRIVNQPAKGLSWFVPTSYRGHAREELFKRELRKINTYCAKGHVADMREVIAYQKWKEGIKKV
jgi:uncharacterized SAM-binding protein YcdF (DUF218 family)